MFDLAIIGAGPAGASAALFAAKAGKNVVFFDHDKSITSKAWVENHYGVEGIKGPDLLNTGQKQAVEHGAQLVKTEVSSMEQTDSGYSIKTNEGKFEAQHILFATGMSTKLAEAFELNVVDGTEPRVAKIIQTNEEGRTEKPGVWAAGTVAGVSVHTIITAGDGARVAVNIISELNGKRYVDHDILK
ncbi:FAD-dependent oxidoreductase [Halobacillus sp. Marseille-Q1614]|uniref:FAD-dependent oxidoreductase n=1 Tax=Halobacillus sp. Marseille-Q1614 TaxID=2709134 RepID=UPI00156E3E4E|nr:FAD-dependent oxidoreductase [Halobacillus sp. Marseille-Q1614]